MKTVIFNFATTPILTEGVRQMMTKEEGLVIVFSIEEEELEMLIAELAEDNNEDDFTFFTL
tara:strand:- start:394 stop:576 length:183 start_codon:yes stop_codon:yes gene_type:complete